MKYCTKCGKALDDNVKFCTSCGAPAPAAAPNNVDATQPLTPPPVQQTPPPQPAPQPRPQPTPRPAPQPRPQTPPPTPPKSPSSSDYGSGDGGNKKTIVILAVALACVVVICAVVLVIFATKDSDTDNTADLETTQVETTAYDFEAEQANYESLKQRYNDAKLKAAKKGVGVKKQKNAAKEALDQYKTAIDEEDIGMIPTYADEAEEYVSKLEKAAKKKPKKKKSTKVASNNPVPESEKTNYSIAPSGSIGEYYFDDYLDDDRDRYCATILAKNEYFAKKGCKFQTPALQNYFNHQKWYTNKGIATTSISLGGTELKNVNRLNDDLEYYKENLSGATGYAKDFSYSDYMDIASRLD